MMKRSADGIDYLLIHSNSPSRVSIHVGGDAVRVYAPRHARLREVDAIVARQKEWILAEKARLAPPMDKGDRVALAREAKDRICARIEYFAPLLGDRRPGRVTIREQKTRWGSCSRKGNVNFNWKLIRAPEKALDYVVIHELCHLYEFNHSPRFWQLVASIQPDYATWKQWLAQNGRQL